MLKGFNETIFIRAAIVLALLCAACLAMILGHGMEVLGPGIATQVVSRFIYVIRFPTHVLLGFIFNGSGLILFILSFLFNAIIYSVLVERLFFVFKSKAPKKQKSRRRHSHRSRR